MPENSRFGILFDCQRSAREVSLDASEELLGAFESSPGKFRRFCTRCGSHLFAERLGQPAVMLRLGCLDSPISGFDPNERVTEFAEGPGDVARN